MYLLQLMDWDNPYVLSPVFGMPHIPPQLLVNSFVTNLGQSMCGENCASLGRMAVCGVSKKELLKYCCTAVDANVIKECNQGVKPS
jgi:hypothetical protein